MFNNILEGKTILVTGASSGIGRCVAITCSLKGASVILMGRNQERLQETLSSMDGNSHSIIPVDICDEDAMNNVVKSLPMLDGFVNSAGINDKALVKTLSREKIDKVFNTNVYGPILLTRSLIKVKKLNAGAALVFISSISASFASISNALYASSKAAIEAFSKVLALEVAPRKIRVNCIRPGIIDTPILGAYTLKEELEAFTNQFPLGRIGKPEEVADLVLYLLSDSSAWMTGSVITLDGGITLK